MNLRLLFSGFLLAAATLLTAQDVAITFNVGTESITVSDQGIYIAGGETFGDPGTNELTDPDGDGVYSITVMRPSGFTGNYTFTNGACPDYSCKENIAGQSCADGQFNDRLVSDVTSDIVVSTCFGQCSETTACATISESQVTFTVDMAEFAGTFTSLSLAGTFNGWSDASNPMTDNGDGTHSTTVTLVTGEQADYKFVAVGAVGDTYEVLDSLDGQSCVVAFGDNGEFVNRVYTPTEGTETAPTVCYGRCESCGFTVATSDVTLTVNMSDYAETFTSVNLAGPFNGWTASASPMTSNGDGTYSITVNFLTNEPNEYKFVALNEAAESFENVNALAGQSCVIVLGDNGEFVNRVYTPTAETEAAPTVCYESCDDCAVRTIDLAAYGIDFNLYPTVVNQELTLNLGQQTTQQSTVQIVTAEGKLVQTMKLIGEQRQQLDVSQLPAGLYFVRLQHRDAVGVRRFVKQ